jgi:hypothetical protein
MVAKSSHTSVGVDGLAYLMPQPMACSRQTRGQGFLSDTVLSHHSTMGGGVLLGDMQPPGLDICGGVSLPGYLCHRVLHRVHCFLP